MDRIARWSFVLLAVVGAVVCALIATGCGPARQETLVYGEPVWDAARTSDGSPVFFGESLRDHPDWRESTVAQIDAAEAAIPSFAYLGLTFYVYAGPLWTSQGPTTSLYDPVTRSVFLSWTLAGPVGRPDEDSFSVGLIPYELANVRCDCESGLVASTR